MLELLHFSLVVKALFVVLTFFYILFLGVVYRQINLMTRILESPYSPLIKTAVLGQLAAATFLFILALVLA